MNHHVHQCMFLGRPFVKRFALSYRTVVCLSACLSVTFVYCGQTVGWFKMKLGVEVGLDPGHIVLNVDPDPPPQKGTAPNFRPMSIVATGRPSQLLLSTCIT